MKYLSIFLALMLAFPSYGGGVSRSRARVVQNYNNNDVIIEQKVIQYDNFSQLQVIAVPVTDLGLQYYYQSEPLRGRNLSEEDRDAIVKDIVAGVLAGIQSSFEVVPNDNKPDPIPEDVDLDGSASKLDDQILTLTKNNCATCHTAGKLANPNAPILLTEDGKLNILTDNKLEKLRRYDIHDSIYSGRMPKNNGILSDSEAKLYHDWIKEVK